MHFLAAVTVLLASYGTGSLATIVLTRRLAEGLRGRATAFTAGFVLLALYAFTVGRLGVFRPATLIPVVAVFAVLGLAALPPVLRDARRAWAGAGWERWLVLAAGAIALFDAVIASAPPTSGDAIAYHLAVPKIWLAAHRTTDIWWDWATFQPLGAELHYSFAQAISNGQASMLVGAGFAAFSGVCVYGLARSLTSARVAAIALLLWVAQGMYVWEATGAFTEIITAGFLALALWHLVEFQRSREPIDAGWAGLAAGAAAGTKYFGLFVLPFIALAVPLLVRETRLRVRASLAFVALVAVALPWYVKNWIVAGNPVFPVFGDTFGGRYWGPSASAYLAVKREQYGVSGIWHLPIIPIEFLLKTGRFDRGYAINPAFFALAPFALLSRKRWTVVLGGSFVLYFAIWFEEMLQIPRYLTPALPLTAVLAAFATVELWKRQLAWRVLAGTLLVVSAVPFFAMNGLLAWRLLPGALGLQSRAAVVQKQTGTYDALHWLDANLPPQGTLLIGLRGVYWLKRPYARFDPPLFGELESTGVIAARMRELDVRYMAFFEGQLPKPIADLRSQLTVLKVLDVPYVTSRALGRVAHQRLYVYRWNSPAPGA